MSRAPGCRWAGRRCGRSRSWWSFMRWWVGGLQRWVVGAPVNALWKGAHVAQGQIRNLIRDLAQGNGGSAEGKPSGRTQDRVRIDFIPLRDASGEVEGFAVVRQMVGTAAAGLSESVTEIYELLFELNADEFSGLLAAYVSSSNLKSNTLPSQN